MLSLVQPHAARVDSATQRMSHRILLLGGDAETCIRLRQFFAEQMMAVKVLVDNRPGVAMASSGTYDLVLLNASAPPLGGFEVLRLIRARCDVPVIMLTSAAPGERITALLMGADDCVSMPCNFQELIARVQAVLRRYSHRAHSPRPIEIGSVRIDPGSRRVWIRGTLVELTSAEYLILETLMRTAGRVVTRERLVWTLRQRESSGLDRSLDVHVAHLRNKIGRPSPIRTVRGEGYFFCNEPVEMI